MYSGKYNPVTTAFVLLVAVMVAGCSVKREPEPANLEQWLRSMDAVPGDARSAEHFERLGDHYLKKDQPKLARTQYEKAVAARPGDPDLKVKAARALSFAGGQDQALAELKAVLETDPGHASANQEAGLIYFRSGMEGQAATMLDAAIAADPGMWRARVARGIIANHDQEYDAAEIHFEKALAVSPGRAEALNNLGVTFIMTDRFDSAVPVLQAAVRAGATDEKTYNNLGLALARLGRIDEALEAFTCAGNEAKAHNNVGYLLYLKGDYAAAKRHLERAMELSPRYYAQAGQNLKRAKLAMRFSDSSKGTRLGFAMDRPKDYHEKKVPTPTPEVRRVKPSVAPTAAPVAPARSKVARVSFKVPMPEIAAKPSVVSPEPASAVESAGDERPFGIHISSWRSLDKAVAHTRRLGSRGVEVYVNRVVLDEKGVWYRVLAGRFASREFAGRRLAAVKQDLGVDSGRVVRLHLPGSVAGKGRPRPL